MFRATCFKRFSRLVGAASRRTGGSSSAVHAAGQSRFSRRENSQWFHCGFRMPPMMKSCVSAKANSEASSTGTERGRRRTFPESRGTVQPVDQRFHGADKPRGQYEIPIAVAVLRAVKSVQVIPERGASCVTSWRACLAAVSSRSGSASGSGGMSKPVSSADAGAVHHGPARMWVAGVAFSGAVPRISVVMD